MIPNTAAYASATLQQGFAPSPAALSVAGTGKPRNRGYEPRSRQNIIGDSSLTLGMT